jgi:hypothetical protein
MNNLVERLSQGWHPVEIRLRPEPTMQALQESLDRGRVQIKFTDTQGGTEIGVPLDRERTDVTAADFEDQHGQITIAGELQLDYVKVRCIAEIDLATLRGRGRLETVDQVPATAN